jgi:F-type H+-transporting ATPase subunit alpha
VLIIWAATSGQIDDIPVEHVRRFEADFLRFVESSHPGILNAIREKKALTDEIKNEMTQAVNDFKGTWKESALNPQPEPPGAPQVTSGAPPAPGAASAETTAAANA